MVDELPELEYFDIKLERGALVLYPVDGDGAGRVRVKLEELGIDEKDIGNAIEWASSDPLRGSAYSFPGATWQGAP